ncbi:MAG: hypothetical protein F4Z15_05640 [Gammaproteobacteria bacterium]|nr:hypothetical protein [Gammaproteobacteria bacterium]MYD76668.1 hypothetical protein [Gammaproteobacteria bacterium]MYJ53278.1 hypothetical protein [Gammaproteobacteria bacterium]
MRNLRAGHIVEAVFWLGLVLFLYLNSFDFDQEIEIYKYGASAWPRAILLLIAVAAVGQFAGHWLRGENRSLGMLDKASDDGAEAAARLSDHNNPKWYAWTFLLLAIPFIYMNLPEILATALSLEKPGLHTAKLLCAAALLIVFILAIRGNPVGGMLTLPLLFGAFLQDFGFYFTAPLFVLGTMYLMGERRWKSMIMIGALIIGILLALFVSLLYVGLPTGNISPFYEFGTAVVNLLQ